MSMKTFKAPLPPGLRSALKDIVYHQLHLWDAGRDAEKVLEALGNPFDVDTRSDAIDHLCADLDHPADAFDLSDETLIEVFLEGAE